MGGRLTTFRKPITPPSSSHNLFTYIEALGKIMKMRKYPEEMIDTFLENAQYRGNDTFTVANRLKGPEEGHRAASQTALREMYKIVRLTDKDWEPSMTEPFNIPVFNGADVSSLNRRISKRIERNPDLAEEYRIMAETDYVTHVMPTEAEQVSNRYLSALLHFGIAFFSVILLCVIIRNILDQGVEEVVEIIEIPEVVEEPKVVELPKLDSFRRD